MTETDKLVNDPFAAMNPFQRAAAKAKALKDAPPKKEKTFEEEREEVRNRFWGNRHGNSHVPLDAATEKARQEYLADRAKGKDSARAAEPRAHVEPMTTATYNAVVLEWQRRNPTYYQSEWNGEQFLACIQDHVLRGETFSYEMLDRIFIELTQAGNLEPIPGPRIRGQFVLRSAPRAYERKLQTPAEKLQLLDRQRSAEESEEAAAKAMPLDQLRKLVRAGRRDTRQADLRGGR